MLNDLADLRRQFLFAIREPTDVTAVNDAADRYLNIALHDIHIAPGGSVPWAVREARLLTHANYETGTVAIDVSASRTAVTGTSTTWDTADNNYGYNNARVGGKIKFGGSNDIYNVSAVGSDTSITLNETYAGDDDLSGASYRYFEDEYALATDFFRPVDMRSFSVSWNISFIGDSDFNRRYPHNSTVGRPETATLIKKDYISNITPQYRIVLHPAPNDAYTIPYHYITTQLAVSSAGTQKTELVADADEPIMPLRYRHAIVYHALFNWYRDRKDDTRAQMARAEFVDLMRRVLAETKVGQDKPSFRPRSYFNRPNINRGRRFQTGSEFDELWI